jgi:hypothetical protein
LRHAKVGGVEYRPPKLVPDIPDLGQKPFKWWSTRLIVKRQGVDVLQDEMSGTGLFKNSGEGLQQAGSRIDPGALPLKPKSRFGEGGTWRTADKEIRSFPSSKSSSPQNVLGCDASSDPGGQGVEVSPQNGLQSRKVSI